VNLLGLDTSTPDSAVGLRLADGRVLEAYDHPGAQARPGHQARLLPLAAELLARGEIDFERLDRIAVGVGPGTYTGLRVGVATARGLAQSLAIEIVGVSSSLVLAHAALRALATESRDGEHRREGHVLTLVDARRGEVFVAAYAGTGASSLPEVLSAPRPVRTEDAPGVLANLAASAPALSGRQAWLAVGDAVPSLRAALAPRGIETAAEDSSLHHVSAAALCDLASGMPAQTLEDVLPAYCRAADAEIALERHQRMSTDGRDADPSAGAEPAGGDERALAARRQE
jgi:tRNA threonylcarbamoyladenosine biosynthesis protein TsaB